MRIKCSVCGRYLSLQEQFNSELNLNDSRYLCDDHQTKKSREEKTTLSGVTKNMSTKPAIQFSELFPKAPQETDRYELKAGTDMMITGIVISEATKYGKVAKINAVVDDEPKKFYTTAKIVVRQCEDIISRVGGGAELRQPVCVHVAERVSKENRKYLELE